jgi:hypothetical protein
MIHRKLAAIGTVCLIGAGIAFTFFGQRTPKTRTSASAESRQLEETRAAIADLRGELRRTQAMNVAIKARADSDAKEGTLGSNSPPAPGDVAEAIDPIVHAKREVTTEDISEGLNTRFYAEDVDRNWSASARANFQSRLSAALPSGSRLVSLECKSSMCRAEVSQPSVEAHQSFVQSAFMPPAQWDGSTMVSLKEEPGDGSATSLVFLAREGQGLSVDDE